MWDTRVVEKIDDATSLFSASCKFKSVITHHEWVFSGVYGPQSNKERLLKWEELVGLTSWWGSPWCIEGDFNVTRFPSDAQVGSTLLQQCRGSQILYHLLDLMDPPLERGRFTCSNSREIESMTRLDRFLFSPYWEDQFPTITQRRLPRLLSDHFPIMLECGQFLQGPHPIRFENMWFKAEGFVDHVRQ
jgi:hypothetical protein